MADSGTFQVNQVGGLADKLTTPPKKSPIGPQDSDKDSADLPQGSNGVPDDGESVQNDGAGLIWPVLLVVAVLLSLWARNQVFRGAGDGTESRQHPEAGEPGDEPWRCAGEVKLTPVPYSRESTEPPRYHAQGSVNVPVTADIMSFVNMYKDEDGCAGAFRVSQTAEPGSEATVDIDVSYAQPGAYRDVRVCRLRPMKHHVGEVFRLGIDTPETDGLESWSNETRHRALHVDIHLQLPRAHAGSSVPLEIKELHTDLHQYHHLLSTPPSARFQKLNLSTVLARIESESVSADMASLSSTYNTIRGAYNISRALIIQTEDGLVDITAQLHNDGPSADPTVLNITTIEGAIFSEVSLHTSSPSIPRGTFAVAAATGHASINLTVLSAPPASVLTASVSIAAPDGDWLALWGDDWDPSFWDSEWDFDPVMPARVTVRVPESFEGAVDLAMEAPTAFAPQVVPYAYVYGGAEALEVDAEDPEHGGLPEDGPGTCDPGEGAEPGALRELTLSKEDMDHYAARWSCTECMCVRRVDAVPLEIDGGRAIVGGISWGAEKLSKEELERDGKIIVRTMDSPIMLIV